MFSIAQASPRSLGYESLMSTVPLPNCASTPACRTCGLSMCAAVSYRFCLPPLRSSRSAGHCRTLFLPAPPRTCSHCGCLIRCLQLDLRAWEVQYPVKLRAPGVAVYARVVGPPQAQLIEVAMAAATQSYVSVGWRPASLDQVRSARGHLRVQTPLLPRPAAVIELARPPLSSVPPAASFLLSRRP